jgi:hypothetical protein
MLDGYQRRREELLDTKLTELKTSMQGTVAVDQEEQLDTGGEDMLSFADGDEENVLVLQEGHTQATCITYRTYSHQDRFWDVPKDFTFPTGVRVDTGWKMWIGGLPGNETMDPTGTA